MKKIISIFILNLLIGQSYCQDEIGLYVQELNSDSLPNISVKEGFIETYPDGSFYIYVNNGVDGDLMLDSDQDWLSVYFDDSVIVNVKKVISAIDTIEINSFFLLKNPYPGYKICSLTYDYYYSGIEDDFVVFEEGPVLASSLVGYWLNKNDEIIVRYKPIYKDGKRIYSGHFNRMGRLSSIYYTGFERSKSNGELIIDKQKLLFKVDIVELTGFPGSLVKLFAKKHGNGQLIKRPLHKGEKYIYIGYYDDNGVLESITYIEYKLNEGNKITVNDEMLLLRFNESPIFEYTYYTPQHIAK